MDIGKRTKQFKMGTTSKESAKQDRLGDINALKIEKLNFKVTLMSVIFPIVIGILIIFIYTKLEKSIFSGLSSGSEGMKQIERAFKKETDYIGIMYRKVKEKADNSEKVINSFKKEFENLNSKLNNEKLIINKLDKLDKDYSVASMKIGELEKNITSKSSKEELEKIDLTVKNSTETIKESLSSIKKDLDSFKTKVEEKNEINSFNIEKDKELISSVEKRVATIETQKDKKEEVYIDIINKHLMLQKRLDNLYKMIKKLENSSKANKK